MITSVLKETSSKDWQDRTESAIAKMLWEEAEHLNQTGDQKRLPGAADLKLSSKNK